MNIEDIKGIDSIKLSMDFEKMRREERNNLAQEHNWAQQEEHQQEQQKHWKTQSNYWIAAVAFAGIALLLNFFK